MKSLISLVIVSVFVFFGAMICSCGTEKEESKKEKTEATPAVKKTEVYKPSGLALLMEDMSDDLFVLKKCIEEKQSFPDSINLNYHSIYSEKHTDDAETNNDIFKGAADAYLIAVANLQNTTEQDRVKNFNAVATGCLNCHSNFCPGPVDRIKKLFISVK